MTRDEYLEALLPAARQTITHFVGAERERRAKAMLDECTDNELSLMYAKQVASGSIKPKTPAMTDAYVEAVRLQGEAELEALREQHRDKAAAQMAEQAADYWAFQQQVEPQRKLEAEAVLARDRAAFDDAAKILRSFSRNQANFNLCRQVLGDGNLSVHLIGEGVASGLLQLSKITQTELDEYRVDDVKAANRRLLDMDPLELRAEMIREQQRRAFITHEQETKRIAEAERNADSHMDYAELPQQLPDGTKLDSLFFRKAKTETLKFYIRKFGPYQVSDRIRTS
jgi:hypothetical protein